MGVNKNISILMIFDCVLVNTGLRFHWICKREERGGGICKLMIISILNHFSLLRLLIVFDWWKHINIDVTLPFWVIMRSGRRNVMNHIASRGTIFGRSFVGVRGFFYHESYCNESVIMTIYGFLNIQIVCEVSSGMGLCPYMGNGCVYGTIWERRNAVGFWGA